MEVEVWSHMYSFQQHLQDGQSEGREPGTVVLQAVNSTYPTITWLTTPRIPALHFLAWLQLASMRYQAWEKVCTEGDELRRELAEERHFANRMREELQALHGLSLTQRQTCAALKREAEHASNMRGLAEQAATQAVTSMTMMMEDLQQERDRLASELENAHTTIRVLSKLMEK